MGNNKNEFGKFEWQQKKNRPFLIMIIFIFYIFFTCLGTSLPDLFASKNAAQNEQYADAAVGNVTGSNGVNVFLGLGIPWIIATIYHKVNVSLC